MFATASTTSSVGSTNAASSGRRLASEGRIESGARREANPQRPRRHCSPLSCGAPGIGRPMAESYRRRSRPRLLRSDGSPSSRRRRFATSGSIHRSGGSRAATTSTSGSRPKSDVAASTRLNIEGRIKKHIRPFFEEMTIRRGASSPRTRLRRGARDVGTCAGDGEEHHADHVAGLRPGGRRQPHRAFAVRPDRPPQRPQPRGDAFPDCRAGEHARGGDRRSVPGRDLPRRLRRPARRRALGAANRAIERARGDDRRRRLDERGRRAPFRAHQDRQAPNDRRASILGADARRAHRSLSVAGRLGVHRSRGWPGASPQLPPPALRPGPPRTPGSPESAFTTCATPARRSSSPPAGTSRR